MKLEATSTSKFKKSKKSSPNVTEVFKIRLKKKLKVRVWAGKDYAYCGFASLEKDTIVSVCDSILSKAGHTWYYIKTPDGHYGFIYAENVDPVSDKAIKFIRYLANYHRYIKNNRRWFEYGFMSELTSFAKAKERIAKLKKVGITCLVPLAWALNAMGIKRADGKPWVSGNFGSFKDHYTGKVKENLERITKGGAVGKTVKQAVDKDLLKVGDILAFDDKTHTFAWSGKGYMMYEGGHRAMKNGKYTGCMASYENEKQRISEILRWRE